MFYFREIWREKNIVIKFFIIRMNQNVTVVSVIVNSAIQSIGYITNYSSFHLHTKLTMHCRRKFLTWTFRSDVTVLAYFQLSSMLSMLECWLGRYIYGLKYRRIEGDFKCLRHTQLVHGLRTSICYTFISSSSKFKGHGIGKFVSTPP